jgi:2-amino-4-hydroxy-6-hydroxymethyldihydropteridine diphosphokinase
MPEVFVGVGSNMEPRPNLRFALEALGARFGALDCSSVYSSPPFGFEGADFLNMVVAFRSALAARVIDDVLSTIEHSRGRKRRDVRYASRTLDLDLLLFGTTVDADLRLPRDDIVHYPFVLAPLAEIAPGLVHPINGRSMEAAWARMQVCDGLLCKLGDTSCLYAESPADAAATVDGKNLSGHVRSVAHEK